MWWREEIKGLDRNHWHFEDYKQIMQSKYWKQILLTGGYRYMVNGVMRTFKAKSLGFGVVEVYKLPIGKDK